MIAAIIALSALLALTIIASAAYIAYKERKNKDMADSGHYKKVSAYSFWDNGAKECIPQTRVYDMIMEHIGDDNGRTKKVAFLGWDGARAESLGNLIVDRNKPYNGESAEAIYSAVNYLRKEGGLYLSYAGGEVGKASEQATSTAPGWAAITTGVWHTDNGVPDNGYVKSMDYKTFMLTLAEKYGYRTNFGAIWKEHFEDTYVKELQYACDNCVDMRFHQCESDFELHEYTLRCVSEGDQEERDIIFSIYELPDMNGHSAGFGQRNAGYVNSIRSLDNMCYEVIERIKARKSYDKEDWLILITSDHGGLGRGHGRQNGECRTTFIASNKKLKNEYFGVNYDGYRERK